MTVDDCKEAHELLQTVILKLITDYEYKTGLFVRAITLQHPCNADDAKPNTIGLDILVVL